MKNERVYSLIFTRGYPHCVKKAETKGRTKEELDELFVGCVVLVPKGNAFNSRWSFRPTVMIEKATRC